MTGRTRLTVQAAIATLAASSALSAVFADMRWLLPVAGAIAVVAAINELTRRSPVAAALGPVLAAAGVLCYITAIDTADTAYARVVPTGSSLAALGDLARSGFDDIRSLATPVPTHRGLVLLAVVALAAVELVVDLIAVTLRRAAAAGLPLLAVFAVCTSVAKGGVGWIPFGIATGGYLWLLLTDSRDRISRWGRTLGSDPTTRPHVSWADTETAPSPLSALGRRIGATAIAVGVVVPMLIPGLHGGLPKHGSGGGGTGSGSSQVVTLNPIVNIRAQLTSPSDVPLIRLTTTDDSPGYLRMTALDRFDGTTFSPSTLVASAQARVSKGIKAPQVTGTSVQSRLSVDNLAVHWLPLPTQVEAVHVNGDWRYDPASNTVFSARSDTKHLTYTSESVPLEPTAAELQTADYPARGDVAGQYLELPSNMSEGVIALANAITEKATTPFAKALAIQNYLKSPPFTYDTSVAASDSNDALEQFLLVTKRGFCQQYAASMAVLARIAGIPSRVAVGFTRGQRQSDGSWLITTHDAHAWPELYFSGFGWLGFEPTPRSDGQAMTPAFADTPVNSLPTGNGSDTPRIKPGKAPGLSPADRKNLEKSPAAAAAVARRHRQPPSRWWLLPAIVALLLPVPGFARVISRRRRWRGALEPVERAHAAWTELRATAIDAGVDWLDGVTPRAAGRLLVAEGGVAGADREALNRLVRAEERARYAADAGTGSGDLRADVTTVGHALVAGQSRARRIAGRVWPRSTLLAVRRVTATLADALDLLDLVGVRLREWIQRRRPRAAL